VPNTPYENCQRLMQLFDILEELTPVSGYEWFISRQMNGHMS
jgi:hypothetical protein